MSILLLSVLKLCANYCQYNRVLVKSMIHLWYKKKTLFLRTNLVHKFVERWWLACYCGKIKRVHS